MICVGTPSQLNGELDLRYVRSVCEEIGAALRDKRGFHVVVVRSTMLPGTMRDVVIPTLEERSGKTAGVDFGVCNNPEFLREGTAVCDFRHPPKTVIGETDARGGDTARVAVRRARRAADPHQHRDGRDGEVRRQRLARAQGRVSPTRSATSARRSASTATR